MNLYADVMAETTGKVRSPTDRQFERLRKHQWSRL